MRTARRRFWRFVAKCGAASVAVSILVVLLLRWLPPPFSTFMLIDRIDAYRNGRTGYTLYYQWVPWTSISPSAALAAVAAEDQRFLLHRGFDFKAISLAMDENRRRRVPRGASTISQQVAKNLFLWSGRSYLRKGLEAYFTVLIETLWTKRRILEVYLNIAEFGDGVFGVEAASRVYFKTSARNLSSAQAALLAAVLPNPHRYKVALPSARVLAKRSWILRHMSLLGGTGYVRNF